ncbi:hypothetical protein GCM10007103_28270 [Salinimicrobium marinum]|uniref:DUF6973 domain-containing protein n=1 Tax=Salinimicrobium marinum TaxID=680283 RepID=A0A918SJW2_9FLAO|nr:hypothetical protein [Salinimicrobium marinum]GHA45558.1 hypothetical protein GCM10007103_28270 [Salinimicrobium marinum]
MTIAARIKSSNFHQLFTLSKVFIQKPLFIIPTLNATRKTIQICNSNFGKAHHKNTPANAFRHALWNFLICEKCYRISGSAEKVMHWSKKITDLHERLAPNKELAQRMDLHNNLVGRSLFKEHVSERIDIVIILMGKLKDAVKISEVKNIERAKNNLVFIEN